MEHFEESGCNWLQVRLFPLSVAANKAMMEFHDKSPVVLNAIRRIDNDYVEEPKEIQPKTDKYGFTGGVTHNAQ